MAARAILFASPALRPRPCPSFPCGSKPMRDGLFDLRISGPALLDSHGSAPLTSALRSIRGDNFSFTPD
jgi:hypothetical protein